MGALSTLFSLLVLVGSAWGDCRQSDWVLILDGKNAWATCNANEYIKGFYRNDRGNFFNGGDGIYRLEHARCCNAPPSYGNQNAECMTQNWWHVLDGNNAWALCPDGHYLQGIFKSDHNGLHNIEEGKCCKPPGYPNNWGDCYEHDVTRSFDGKGWSECNQGYYLVGIYKGTCDNLYCLEKFKCCKMQENRVNGGWSSFGVWGACSSTCGAGIHTRHRTCTNPPPAHGGAQCSGQSSQSEVCNNRACPVNGGWSAYGRWGRCSKTCGGGSKTRTRSCTNPPPSSGGAYCSGSDTLTQVCGIKPCPGKAVNGGWTKWSAYGACSKTCGKGKKYKTRTCTKPPPSNGGKDCKGRARKGAMCNKGKCRRS